MSLGRLREPLIQRTAPTGVSAKQLVLTDDILMKLAGRADVLRAYPFLRPPKGTPARSCCAKRSSQAAFLNHSRAVKQVLAGLPADKLVELKRLTGYDRLVMFVLGPRGVEQKVL